MKSIKMDFIRSGGETGTLIQGQDYHVVVDYAEHRQFNMPLDQEAFLDLLVLLRYHEQITPEQRDAALKALSKTVTEVLNPPDAPVGEMLQIDLVTDARELWALPFEAALAGDNRPLLARHKPAVVLTRRAPLAFVDRKLNWPARPRVLFVYANWGDAHRVPASEHKVALLRALRPWIDPLEDIPMVIGDEASVLTTLEEASLSDIAQACRQAEAEKRPYTHIHLLAHGVESHDPVFVHRKRYGIGLCTDDGQATAPEAFVEALRAPGQGTGLLDTPIVVTLAMCDSGNAANTIVKAGGLAQELHRAGVSIVVASQLPMTFTGSEIMTQVFYTAWKEGKDVREALHETRLALYASEASGHDWVSLVAYVHLPEGYQDYLFNVRLQSQLAALETASNYAKKLLEESDAWQYDQVTERMKRRVDDLYGLLEEEATGYTSKKTVLQENAGLLGSAHKRLAELYALRAEADPPQRDRWLQESRSALTEAREAYHEGFLKNTAHHWSGVQYLALDAVLKGKVAHIGEWYTCQVSAARDLEHADNEQDKIWALGSLAELNMLAKLSAGQLIISHTAADLLDDLVRRVKASASLFPDLSPIVSTRRQLERYVTWWTKENGFFVDRANDLATEAKALVQRLAS